MAEPTPSEINQQIRKLAGSIRWLGMIVLLNCILLAVLIVILCSPAVFHIPVPGVAPADSQKMATLNFPLGNPSQASVSVPTPMLQDDYQDFYTWPIEKQIAAATVIFVTKNEERDGQLVGVITEILKKKPGVSFYYSVGDIYDREVGKRRPGAPSYTPPPGMVVFCVGNPAHMRYAASYSEEDRVTSLGGLSFEQLKALINRIK